jgi:hypothetical protein
VYGVRARHNEIQTVNVRSVAADDLVDGERLPLAVKDLGSCDLYPQVRSLNSNVMDDTAIECARHSGDGERYTVRETVRDSAGDTVY